MRIAIFASLLMACALPAHAQDSLTNKEETQRFEGLYLGAGGSYGDFGNSGSSGLVDLFIGGRVQTESGWVYGIEGAAGVGASDDENFDFIDLDGYAAILAKVGYTSDNRLLVYGGAGYSALGVDENLPGTDDTQDSLVLEAGLEYMPSHWFGLRLRGQYQIASDSSNLASIGAGLFFSF